MKIGIAQILSLVLILVFALAAGSLTIADGPVAVETAPETEAAPEEPAVVYRYANGEYTGKGRGMGGDITVVLTIENDVITVNEITGPYETPGVGGKEAIEDGTFKEQIEAKQSADIDGIAGATMTSGGVRKAVQNALAEARAAQLPAP